MATETASAQPSSQGPRPPAPTAGRLPTAFASGALSLLACGAFAVFAISLLVLPGGPSETGETLSWVFAFALALPAGFVVAARQAQLLADAAPAAAARALAAGLVLLALALVLRGLGTGDRLHHALLALAALGALAAPFFAALRWRDPEDGQDEVARILALAALASIALLFVPDAALRPANLIPALALAAGALLLLRFHPHWRQPRWARWALDALLCAILALGVVQLPDLVPFAGNLLLHHAFFLGPANDVLHGRAMLDDSWSQYGVGVIDALGLTFAVVPIGFGTFALIIVALTVAQFLCTYAILRLAGLGQILAFLTMVVAALGNLFSPIETYVAFPSDSPLRFGLPYLMVLFAVLAGRYPARARPARLALLLVLAISATWSFEAFVYCGATYGALVLVEALAAGTEVVRRVLRGAAVGLGVSALAVALLSLLTLIFSGGLDWGPYFEYIQLYSVGEFSQLPIEFFSAGPLMAAVIFASAVVLLWLAHYRSRALAPPMRAALAGFTGVAIVTFTYYVGRSHPNNLLVLLVPVVALAGLWIQVLLAAPSVRWRIVGAASIAVGMAMIAVASWPSVEQKGKVTALGLVAPGGDSLGQALTDMTDNPVLDPRAPVGAEMLARHLPPGAPALVLTEPALTTETLMRAGRRNLLPISHIPEDALIDSSWGRLRAAAARVPVGTLMLTSPLIVGPPPGDGSPEPNELTQAALAALQRRFAFQPIERTPEGLELVRLVSWR